MKQRRSEELHNLRRHLCDNELENGMNSVAAKTKRPRTGACGRNLTSRSGFCSCCSVSRGCFPQRFLPPREATSAIWAARRAFTFALRKSVGLSHRRGRRAGAQSSQSPQEAGRADRPGAYVGIILAITLSLAHYREVSAAMIADCGAAGAVRLRRCRSA